MFGIQKFLVFITFFIEKKKKSHLIYERFPRLWLTVTLSIFINDISSIPTWFAIQQFLYIYLNHNCKKKSSSAFLWNEIIIFTELAKIEGKLGDMEKVTYTVYQLAPGTAYALRIKSSNSRGNAANLSNMVQFTTGR